VSSKYQITKTLAVVETAARDDHLLARFFGTLAPFFRASESPIAIACFLLVTLRPDLPLFSVPALRFFIARPTVFAAPLEYFRFFAFLAMALILSGFAIRIGTRRSAKGSFCR
jgi:hypothetical protein